MLDDVFLRDEADIGRLYSERHQLVIRVNAQGGEQARNAHDSSQRSKKQAIMR